MYYLPSYKLNMSTSIFAAAPMVKEILYNSNPVTAIFMK